MIDFGLPNGPRFLKIDARSGCFRVKDEDQDISFTELTAAMDLFHVKVGHFVFTKNGIFFIEGVTPLIPLGMEHVEHRNTQ